MAETATIHCSACGRQTPAQTFCDNCGARLTGGLATPAALSPTTPDDSTPPVEESISPRRGSGHQNPSSPVETTDGNRPDLPPSTAARTERGIVIASNVVSADSATSATPTPISASPDRIPANTPSSPRDGNSGDDDGGCPDLTVAVDQNCMFFEHAGFPLRVRVEARTDVHQLTLAAGVGDGHGGKSVETAITLPKLKAGKVHEASLDVEVPAGMRGLRTFNWRIGYRSDGLARRFEGQTCHEIHPADVNAGQVIDKVIFNITQTGDAGDINIQGGGLANPGDDVEVNHQDGALDFFRGLRRDGVSIATLIKKVQAAPPLWTRLALHDAEGGEDFGIPPAAGRLDRLTLEVGGWLIHLVDGHRLVFGRDRSCDYVTRLFSADGQAGEAANTRISRRHARLEWYDEGLPGIFDGGDDAHASSWGVYVAGHRIAPGGRAQASLGRPICLGLAGPDPAQPGVFALQVEALSCRTHGTAACPAANRCPANAAGSLLLRRTDTVRERVVWLRHCIDGGAILPELRGLWLRRWRNAFLACRGREHFWLTPGGQWPLPTGGMLKVRDFGQYGL